MRAGTAGRAGAEGAPRPLAAGQHRALARLGQRPARHSTSARNGPRAWIRLVSLTQALQRGAMPSYMIRRHLITFPGQQLVEKVK